MKLGVHERIGLLQLIPKEGKYLYLVQVKKAVEVLNFNEEERQLLHFRTEGVGDKTKTMWEDNQVDEKEIEIPEEVEDTVRKILINNDRQKKLTFELFTLYEKFCLTASSLTEDQNKHLAANDEVIT